MVANALLDMTLLNLYNITITLIIYLDVLFLFQKNSTFYILMYHNVVFNVKLDCNQN